MVTTVHHPSDEQLTAFSAASLPLSQALCISVHLEYCSECREQLQRLESLGSELFQSLTPAAPSSGLRQQVLAQLDQTKDRSQPSAPAQGQQGDIPRCLHQFIAGDYNSRSWRFVSPSIRSSELCRDSNGAKVELLRIKPGGSAATHSHLGDEYTVVLQGAFSDEEGLYRKGDFLLRDASHKHTPVATRDEECICLVVSEAPIQFTGFFSRWLNPLLRRRTRRVMP